MAGESDFFILGPLEARIAGRAAQIAGAGQRALLVRLLLDANRVVSFERLIADLWVTPPSSGAQALQQRMAQLRQALENTQAGTQPISTRGAAYIIEPEPEQLDLHRFETFVRAGDEALAADRPADAATAFRNALALWRGEPLADFAEAPFAAAAGARLGELRLAALEKRFDAELALGRQLDVLAELEQLAVEHPFRERFRAQLMLALYRAGRQADALETYKTARQTLVGELGVEPTGALQELERAILRHDPSLELPASATHGSVTPERHAEMPERSILIIPNDTANFERLLAVGEPLTRRPARELILTAVATTGPELERTSALLEAEREALLARRVPARAAAFTSDALGADVVRLASAQDVDLLLTDAPAEFVGEGLPPGDLEVILQEAPCDVAVLVPGDGGQGEGIVVPFGATQHDWAALEMSAWLAASHRTPLTVLGSEARPDQDKRTPVGCLRTCHCSCSGRRGSPRSRSSFRQGRPLFLPRAGVRACWLSGYLTVGRRRASASSG